MSGSPTFTQTHYRIRIDGAAVDSTPTWGAAEDVTYFPGLDAPFRARFAMNNTGTASAVLGINLAYSKNGAAYAIVNAASSNVRLADAGPSATGGTIATASFRLTAGAGAATGGRYFDLAVGANFKPGATTYTEVEFGIVLRAADLTAGDTIALRMYDSDGTAIGTAFSGGYTNTPTITIPAAPTTPGSPTTYTFSNTASALSGSSVNKALVTAGATSGSWSGQSLGSQSGGLTSIVDGSFFTSGVGTSGNNLGTDKIIVGLDVTTGNTNLRYSARAIRVNSSGVVQAYGPLSAETASGAANTYSLDCYTTGLGTWASGDELRVDVRLRNNSTSTGQSATLTYNTVAAIVQATLTSASPDGAASGGTLTVTTSVATSGTASGSANATGATLTVTGSVATSGTATGGASAAGATLPVTVSAIAGTATGSANASGATLPVTVSVIAGSASAGVNGSASGATVTVTTSVVDGAATGGASASGATLLVTVSAVAGTATGGASASGATLPVTVSVIEGTASGTEAGNGAASGATLTVSVSVIGGTATGEEVSGGLSPRGHWKRRTRGRRWRYLDEEPLPPETGVTPPQDDEDGDEPPIPPLTLESSLPALEAAVERILGAQARQALLERAKSEAQARKVMLAAIRQAEDEEDEDDLLMMVA